MDRQLLDVLIQELTGVRDDLDRDLAIGVADVRRALDRLSTLRQASLHLEQLVERAVDNAVLRARDRNASWQQIGRALGISRQSAQQRYLAAVARTGRLGVQTRIPRRMADLDRRPQEDTAPEDSEPSGIDGRLAGQSNRSPSPSRLASSIARSL